MALFAIMSDEDIFFIFNGSPLYFAMLPMIGLLSTILVVANAYELSKANNKNFDRWFGLIVSALCATLASISLYGSVIASYYELNFALGPWFFLASVAVAFTHQFALFSLNCYRAYESLSNSAQRMHYVQAAFNNAYHLGIIAAVAGALTFVMLTPIAPALGSACAITAVCMTAVNLLWKMLPASWRDKVKAHLELDKPKFGEEEVYHFPPDLKAEKKVHPESELSYQRLFTKRDYSAEIQHQSFSQGLNHLQKIIQEKINRYNAAALPHSEKNEQKKALLLELKNSLNNDLCFSKRRLLHSYPLAFQSFWVEESEVESIVKAAYLLKDKYQALHIELEEQATKQLSF
ncbi:hypothetical protein [Legionella sp. km772]|uniref:hypothetical protein n=1 Tax=Legionella sp. km772 TaxID=2498111 RepID=UPI0013157372|nr:hypothetical protein [Legionella sp. km772]